MQLTASEKRGRAPSGEALTTLGLVSGKAPTWCPSERDLFPVGRSSIDQIPPLTSDSSSARSWLS